MKKYMEFSNHLSYGHFRGTGEIRRNKKINAYIVILRIPFSTKESAEEFLKGMER